MAAEPSKCKTQLNASPSRTQAPADRGLQEEAIELPLLGEPSRPWPGKGETVEPTGARYREDGVGNDRCNRLVARPVVEDREPEHGRLFSRGQLTEAPTGRKVDGRGVGRWFTGRPACSRPTTSLEWPLLITHREGGLGLENGSKISHLSRLFL